MSQLSLEQDKFLDQLTDAICRKGLRNPALVILDAGGPFAFLGGQLLWLLQPTLSLFMSGQTVKQMAKLLEEPAAVTILTARLEARKT